MKAVADDNMTALDETFGRFLDITALPGRRIAREDLAGADVLLVRSVTRVDAGLLGGTPVGFVGSATIGTDHLDTAWMDRHGVRWAAAPGCNADAAAQYALGMMMLACRRLERDWRRQRVGIVGLGNVGGRLRRLLETLGVATIACDPPLAERGVDGLVSLDELLDNSDVTSLHVPYTRSGPWATAHMIQGATLARMPAGALIINTSRGGVVEGASLLAALREDRVRAALDVWPDEPEIRPELLERVTVATPHVAGYSIQGKRRGTDMIFDAFQDWSGRPAGRQAASPPNPHGRLTLEIEDGPGTLARAIILATCVERDDAALRAAGPVDAVRFDALRREYPRRDEFSYIDARLSPDERGPAETLEALGFRVRATGCGA